MDRTALKTDSPHTFKIDSPERVKRALMVVSSLDLSLPWKFDLRPYKRNRSLEQQGLYRKWVRVIANDLGFLENDLHEEFKKRFLMDILERDDEDFKEQIAICRSLYQEGKPREAERLVDLLKARASTTWLNVSQFSEMMDKVEVFAGENGIKLPMPEAELD